MSAQSQLARFAVGAFALTLAACGKGDQERTDSAAAVNTSTMPAGPDTGAMGGMSGMSPRTDAASAPAMTGMSSMPGMSADMVAHMAQMKGADGAKMKTMLPEHRTMVTGMLAQMNDQMSSMKMAATPAWNALTDSIRSDLKAMPTMSTQALAAIMPAHEMRMMNLATMHEGMMKGMK